MRKALILSCVFMLISCGDPQDKIINVSITKSRYSSAAGGFIYGSPENSSIRVGDLQWKQYGGVWKAKDDGGFIYIPADPEAVKAIESMMGR
jgi:hypothetical protein